MSKRFALLWCSEEKRIDYRNEMVDVLKMDDSKWDIISAFSDLSQIVDSYDGFVISGSEYSVNNDKERFSGLFDFIRLAHKKEKPIVGICFGCQSLAVALGGEVSFNPDNKFRFGTDKLKFLVELKDQIGGEINNSYLIESHGECVSIRPPGSRLLAYSDSTAVEIFSLDNHILGIQGHPELTREIVEENFLDLHLDEGNIQEDDVQRFESEISEYTPPKLLRHLIRKTLNKNINFKNLVDK